MNWRTVTEQESWFSEEDLAWLRRHIYRVPAPAVISFSGGRTSAYMLKHVLDAHEGALPSGVHVVFANTGKERQETLDFVRECAARWRVEITWVEFDPAAPDSTRIVNYETASRDGEPLRAAIDTRPTPHLFNVVSRYCTATTKMRRISKFMLRSGYPRWNAVLGIRADEPRRVEKNKARDGRDRQNIYMPLASLGVTNEDVLAWWGEQPFGLQLPTVGGETIGGNCDLCPLKAKWKILLAMRENPSSAQWWIDREVEMGERTKRIARTGAGEDRRARFLKSGVSYAELRQHALSDAPILKGRTDESIDCACTD